ncbi:unnamed protein product [Rhodiola kirilowii]
MASAISSFSSAIGNCELDYHRVRDFSSSSSSSSSMPISSRMTTCVNVATRGKNLRAVQFGKRLVVKAVEVDTLVQEVAGASNDSDQPDPVSPSDVLTMLFQAEGTMSETAIPTVTKALEEIEGVTNLKVQVLEGIASVELTKQTTIQATGVASGMVEKIQGSGFKLQTLNLSFLDEAETTH